ncbi:SDR family NAD(P)-dependent oxidoreductase [Pseudonocardia broussonetiae]|uniref:SDR family oxidoreductase n=1 Tax=Pseudonocardia broussonetiae TaxID=2736640 RepID=A0A6M6JQQ1_9PSEU|nr:SDR family NAD(P)-dependent oxidoreductase [Pseudonocardia broussonetiae]QJY49327.1 SDR family oxidoreductase [Pseudonocardia broussonetiae]
MGRLDGRTALVFGGGHNAGGPPGTTGIGFATATTFAAHGARVVVVDRDAGAAERTVDAVREAGGRACAVVADATSPEQVEDAVARTVREHGGLDVVHNNVGVARLGGIEDLTLDEWRAAVTVNLDSVFLSARAALPHLARRRGCIVTVSSTASIRWTGYPYPGYAAAKAAVNQLTRSLAVEYAGRVRVNAILAGLIDTPLVYQQLAGADDPADVRARRDALSPTGAMGTAYDVAHAALFLASDEAAYVTGALLPVDGGLHARAV